MLTPEEIQTREFLVSLRGYDRDEVHAFLDEVAEAYAQAIAQARGAEAAPAPAPAPAPEPEPQPAAAPAAASPFAAIGAETQRILEAAHAAGEEIRQKAQADADEQRATMVAAAEDEVGELQRQAGELRDKIAELEGQREKVADGLRAARETVDLALLELDGAEEVAALPDDAEDPRSSVLAAAADDGDRDDGSGSDDDGDGGEPAEETEDHPDDQE